MHVYMCVALQLFHTPLWVWDTLPFATNIYTPLANGGMYATCNAINKSRHDLFDCDHMACGFMSYPVRRLIIQSVLMCECEMNEWMNSACDYQAIYLALSLHQPRWVHFVACVCMQPRDENKNPDSSVACRGYVVRWCVQYIMHCKSRVGLMLLM